MLPKRYHKKDSIDISRGPAIHIDSLHLHQANARFVQSSTNGHFSMLTEFLFFQISSKERKIAFKMLPKMLPGMLPKINKMKFEEKTFYTIWRYYYSFDFL